MVGNEDSPVAKLIDKLNNSDWVNNGLRYVKLTDDIKCPFCQSNTLTPKLVDEIKDYFDESYQLSIERLKKIKSDYSLFVSSIPNLNEYHQSPHSENYTMKLAKTHAKLMDIIKENNKLIEKKLKSPSLQIQLKDIHPPINDLNSIIDSINYLITESNNKIDNSKEELIKIKNEFWSILRYEYDQTISAFDTTSSRCNLIIIKNKTSLDEKILEQNNKEAELIKLQKSTLNIKEAIDNINLGLTDLGITDFYIENYEDELYRIVRAGISMDVFPSLSEGEKMIISFLYFRELFKGKETAAEVKQKKIAVIDDPVSSLSHIFVYNIGRLIKNDFFNSDNVEQVFVLTHSLYFFYELVDSNKDKRNESQKLFRLSKNTCGTSIETMKYEEIQNDYHSYWSVINDSNQPPALIANCMRNVVEYFFNFVQKADLSNVMQKKELQNIKFQSFIRYINRESHSLGQNIFDFKEFNYNDFKTALKLLFEHTGYPEHYEKMSKIKP
ncbi:AAA family ATPase [Yersinia enterocolitica]|uniref:AAA family ATPase n=1 Tax=Yersinia enterocolitica TaxID=630 RepID=UPI001E58FF0D|nr:AAA family ATPase [Yersinia enterocolitica]